MSVEELIRVYEHTEKKDIAIRNLSLKYNVSEREIIDTLKKYNIKVPKIIDRGHVIDFKESVRKVTKDVELEKDVYPAVSIIKRFEDMGWSEKEGVERAIQLSYYIETKFGLDCFKIYTFVLEYLIKNSGVKGLEKDLDTIQSGGNLNISERKENRIVNTLLGVAEKMVEELLAPETEPEDEIKEKLKEKKTPLLNQFFELYTATHYPEYYRFLKSSEKRKKKKEQEKKQLEFFRIMDNVLKRRES